MKRWKTALSAGAVTLLASGCIPTERDLRIDHDLTSLKSRMTSMEQGLAGQAENRSGEERLLREEVAAMAKRQADLQATQDALRVELQSVRGLLADASAQQREQLDAHALTQQDAALRVGKLEKDFAELQSALARQAEATQVAPESLYDQGLELIKTPGGAAAGRTKLEQFVKQRPQSELVPNALYWMGEAYYSEKNYESAILQFQDVLEKYPSHPKAAAALYKQALAFQALKEPKKARALLKKVVDVYPKSDEARKAKEQLAKH